MAKNRLTYCNPLALPEFQPAVLARRKAADTDDIKWMNAVRRDFREMADPTVIKFEGKWYLFPSCGSLWWTEDFVNWTHHKIEPDNVGYAPTVVQKGPWLYLTACSDEMWRAKHPLGPWELLGNIKDEHGQKMRWNDPCLFVDDDGVMYGYHGLGKDGIYVARMREDDPTQFDGPRVHCFAFEPEHIWERFGEFNQNPDVSYIEGGWITKREGTYYLQYSGPGTELKRYSLGCYVSDKPMGPWRYQKRNPILTDRGGLINGSGHHSMVEGPDGNLWCFYTCLVRIEHRFERRIGMDPVGFDGQGEMFVAGPTETPQWGPGVVKRPARASDVRKREDQWANAVGWLPLSVNETVRASSWVEGREPAYAVDNVIRTWWEAAAGDEAPWLKVDLHREWEVGAVRTLFADRGLDYEAWVIPGPYRYRIEGSLDGQAWEVLVDKSGNTVDKHMEYDQVAGKKRARYVRLVVVGWPMGMRLGVWEFTVFGRP